MLEKGISDYAGSYGATDAQEKQDGVNPLKVRERDERDGSSHR